MRTNAGAIARVVAFTVVSLAFVFILVTVFGQFRFDTRTSYSAVFSNVSGLKGGNFVRIAGVEVGKVSDLKLQKDGTVHVDFAIDKGLRLTEGTKASVRYENLIGDRYLALEDGPGPPRRLPPGRHDSVGPYLSRSRRRRAHRWFPAPVPRVGSRPGQCTVRPTAEGVPG